MEEHFTVRYAAREDMPQVNELRRMVHRLHAEGRPDVFQPEFGSELEAYAAQKLEHEDSDLIVAVTGATVCGFAAVNYVRRPSTPYSIARSFYHIEEFGVKEACRRQGIASALIAFCREEAKKKGFSRMELDMWEFNEGALAFYEAAGFRTFRRYMETDV